MGDLVLGQVVLFAKGAQARAEVKQETAVAVDFGTCVAPDPAILRQRDGEDEFPPRMIGHYGVSERMGTA
jgi:hypothetical protein